MKQWRPSVIDESSATALRLPLLARAMHRELQSWADDCGFIAAPLSEIQAREDASGPSDTGESCSRERAFALFVLRRHGCTRGERKAVPVIVTDLVRLGFLSLTEPGASPEGAALWSLSEHGVPCPEVATRRSASGPQREQPRPTEGTTTEQPRNNHGTNKRVTPRNHSPSLAQSRVNDIETEVGARARTSAHATAATADPLTYLSAFASGAGRRWVEDGSRDERAAVDARLRSIVTSARDAESFGAFTADYLSRSRGKYPAVPALSARKLAYLDRDTGEWNHRELAAAQAEWIDKGETFVARRRAVAVATEDARANAERWSTERSAVETLARAHWHETRAALADGRIVAQIAAPATESAHVAMLLREYAPAPLTSTDAASSHSLSEYRKRESDKATARAGILAAGQIPLRGVRPGYQSQPARPRSEHVERSAVDVITPERAQELAAQFRAARAERERERAEATAREDERRRAVQAETDRVLASARSIASETEVETENQADAAAHTSRSLAAFVAQAAADRARHGQSTRPTWTPPDALDALEERPLPSAKPLTLSPPTKTRSDAQRRDAAPTRPAGGRELP